MRKYIRILCISVAMVLMVSSFAACQTQGKTVKVKLSEVTHSVFYAPQYVAINNGYFSDEGIEIELTNGGGADKVMAAILSGSVDIGLAGPEACIYVYNEGKDDYSQVIGQLTQRDGSFLVSRVKYDPATFDWNNLKGKSLLPGRKGGVPYMTLEYVVKSKGLVPNKDVTFDDSIQFNAMAAAFAGGNGDFVTLFEPTASAMELEGKGTIVASIGAESGEIPYTSYFASQSFLKKNSAVAQKFINALYRGQLWVQNSTPEEIAKAIAPSFPDTDIKLLETVAKRYQDIGAWSTTPMMKQEAFDRLQMVMTEAGELKKNANYDDLINNSYAQKAVDTIK